MRGTIAGLPTPRPIGELLPGVYLEDRLIQSFTAGLDDVMAPVMNVLDSLAAYIDPWLAPADFLAWLAAWVGLELDETWPIERRRSVVAKAVEIFQYLGTAAGLKLYVEVFCNGVVDVAETGGVAVSQVPGAPLPGQPEPRMTVRVTVADPSTVDVQALDRLVASAKPAHVIHRVEVAQG